MRFWLAPLGAAGLALGLPASAGADWSSTTRFAFSPAQSYTTGSHPHAVLIADVTGDGRDDLLVMTGYYFDPENDFKLFVFQQGEDGDLAAPIRYETDAGPPTWNVLGLAAGDVNGDDKTDVVLATGEGIDVFYQSEGALEPAAFTDTSTWTDHVQISDLDGDGDQDIVSSGEYFDPGVALLENTPGGFSESFLSDRVERDLDVGDLNGDGRPDIAGLYRNDLDVLYQRPNGSFDGPFTYSSCAEGDTSYGGGLALADVTGDGRADVVLTIGYNASASCGANVYEQTDDGALLAPAAYGTVHGAGGAEVLDMNGDGLLDAVVGHSGLGVGIYAQEVDGTFRSEQYADVSYSDLNVQDVAAGYLNSDGRPDIAVADFGSPAGVKVLHQLPFSPFLEASLSATQIRYGQEVSVTAQLALQPDMVEREVSFFVETRWQPRMLVDQGDVDVDGNRSTTLQLDRRTIVSVEYGGDDDRYSGATVSKMVVNVRALTTSAISGYYAVSGRYKLYHEGARPVAGCSVLPALGGRFVKFTNQRLADGSWRTVRQVGNFLDDNASAEVELRPRVRGTYRIRCRFFGDEDNLGDASPWLYYRVKR